MVHYLMHFVLFCVVNSLPKNADLLHCVFDQMLMNIKDIFYVN